MVIRMAKLKLSDIDMGLGSTPKSDPLHDAQTLLNHSLGADSDDYRSIPLGQIQLNPQNDYSGDDTDADIEELARDIERNGLLHNIVVSDKTRESGMYMILSGERRYKAVRWLYEKKKENKYALILCKVLTGLDPLDEMLVLDAANLQTRGGMQNEKRFRKATMRFIENLRKKGGVSERDAVDLAVRYTGISDKLIDKNIAVETNLHPEILALLDRDLIPKNQAVQYAHLPMETQKILAENLTSAYESGSAALRDVNDQLFVATKTIADLTVQLESKEKGMREIDEEISNAQLSLSALNAMAENAEEDGSDAAEELTQQMDVVKKTLLDLENQKKMYANTITSAKAALKKSEDKLTKINAPMKTGTVIGDDIAAMVNKSMKKAESGVQGITSRTSIHRMMKLDTPGRRVMLERLEEMKQALHAATAILEKSLADHEESK
ncbi:MAG: ParB N-terminal domain-containing protein [Clostridia bacterium]|nr:ParB N-terminal domain-containing protein [Clostridia bacterium]